MADPAPDPRSAYTAAGVDVDAGERAVRLLRERVGGTRGDLLGTMSGFAAATALPSGYRDPVVVTATDGVGTKTEIARLMGRRDTVGQDLVAMCVDDVACHGARPWLFLDYLAVGRLDADAVAELVSGVARACEAVACQLVGGETAEHPGLMEADAFDLAGFCIGLVERSELLDGSASREGDLVVGIASSGLHSNGYSLVRSVLARRGLELSTSYEELVRTWVGALPSDRPDAGPAAWRTLGDALLEPTRLYADTVLRLRTELADGGLRLGGIAHVTGGGLAKNLPRAVGAALSVEVDPSAWPQPVLFDLIGALAGLDGAELRATFNAGIGMAVVVEPGAAETALGWLRREGSEAWIIGRVVAADAAEATRYREAAG